MKKTILVYDYTDAKHGGKTPVTNRSEVTKHEVIAYCYADFRAVFELEVEGMMCIGEAHGDDGHWWLTGVFDSRHLNGVVEMWNSFRNRE